MSRGRQRGLAAVAAGQTAFLSVAGLPAISFSEHSGNALPPRSTPTEPKA